MRTILMAIVCGLLFIYAPAQINPDSLYKMYQQGKKQEAIARGLELLGKNNDPQIDDIVGRAYMDIGKQDSAAIFFRNVLQKDKDKTWLSGWAHYFIGMADLMNGKRSTAVEELHTTIRLKRTANSVKSAKGLLMLTGTDNFFKNWLVIERPDIIFHFQDTTGIHLNAYIEKHERAYTAINKTFQARLMKKLDYFVWKDAQSPKEVFNKQAGFSEPVFCLSHVHPRQTPGHEMTHTLSYWAWGILPARRCRFINEGISVAFDLDRQDKYENAKKWLRGSGIRSVTEIWQPASDYNDEIMYSTGGAFILYLLEKISTDDFKQIVKNQQVDDCRKILGDRFDGIISGFDALMELK